MRSFLTGSRVYGTPRPNSDVDVVIILPSEDAELLLNNGSHRSKHGRSVRYGNCNFIVFEDTEYGNAQFEIWRTVTESLRARRPVTRDEAIAAFDAAGRDAGEYGEDFDE